MYTRNEYYNRVLHQVLLSERRRASWVVLEQRQPALWSEVPVQPLQFHVAKRALGQVVELRLPALARRHQPKETLVRVADKLLPHL